MVNNEDKQTVLFQAQVIDGLANVMDQIADSQTRWKALRGDDALRHFAKLLRESGEIFQAVCNHVGEC